uniref:Uncharacterized protein n=1 Tax=Arundo donax TaxID=35708 RepID=A0A0A9DZA2_ARUDO
MLQKITNARAHGSTNIQEKMVVFCHEEIQILEDLSRQHQPSLLNSDSFQHQCCKQTSFFFSVIPHSLQKQKSNRLRRQLNHQRSDHTSLRSSYLAFAIEAPCRVLKCAGLLHGEGGALLSYRDARGESRSSRSSSLVYPLRCTIEALRSNSALPEPVSTTFSETSSSEGGQYTTGAAMTGNVLITSLSVKRSSKLCATLVTTSINISIQVSSVLHKLHRISKIAKSKAIHFSKQKNIPQNSAPPEPCQEQDQDRTRQE